MADQPANSTKPADDLNSATENSRLPEQTSADSRPRAIGAAARALYEALPNRDASWSALTALERAPWLERASTAVDAYEREMGVGAVAPVADASLFAAALDLADEEWESFHNTVTSARGIQVDAEAFERAVQAALKAKRDGLDAWIDWHDIVHAVAHELGVTVECDGGADDLGVTVTEGSPAKVDSRDEAMGRAATARREARQFLLAGEPGVTESEAGDA